MPFAAANKKLIVKNKVMVSFDNRKFFPLLMNFRNKFDYPVFLFPVLLLLITRKSFSLTC